MARRKISKEQVVAKLKDDGDFEGGITKQDDITCQGVYSNRPGARNMKPRQLSDAIFQQVGSKMLSQLSDRLWRIIRSEDGMKSEIRDTVQSVYATLSNREGLLQEGPSTGEAERNISAPVPKGETGVGPAGKHNQVAEEENKRETACTSSSSRVSYIDNNSDEKDPELPPGFGSTCSKYSF